MQPPYPLPKRLWPFEQVQNEKSINRVPNVFAWKIKGHRLTSFSPLSHIQCKVWTLQEEVIAKTSLRQQHKLTKVVCCCFIFQLFLLFVDIIFGVDQCLGLLLLK